MNEKLDRRSFLKNSLMASSAAALALSFEEQSLLAQQGQPAAPAPKPAPQKFPMGKLGKLSVSRMICGGNLIAGFAHSRDLIYVSELLKRYFSDIKVFETLELCELHGINTAILRLDENTLRILKNYRKERGGKIQWIAQVKVKEDDLETEIKKAVDNGAVGVYVHGGVGDEFVRTGRPELLGKAVEIMKKNGVVAGIAGHNLEVPMACEKAGINADFFMKTFNSKQYWSAGPMPRYDSVWEETPEKTIAFMQEVDKPWIAYKVLGAGAIHPRQGFQYAYQNGADFICVGMFDYQIAEDVALAKDALERTQSRNRPWSA